MDFAAVMSQINYWAVLAAAGASFVLGRLVVFAGTLLSTLTAPRG
jgi:hypothetical protein